jgi:hypothetical protein
MDAVAAEQHTIVLDVLMMETMANKTELQQICNCVAKVITEELSQTELLD